MGRLPQGSLKGAESRAECIAFVQESGPVTYPVS